MTIGSNECPLDSQRQYELDEMNGICLTLSIFRIIFQEKSLNELISRYCNLVTLPQTGSVTSKVISTNHLPPLVLYFRLRRLVFPRDCGSANLISPSIKYLLLIRARRPSRPQWIVIHFREILPHLQNVNHIESSR